MFKQTPHSQVTIPNGFRALLVGVFLLFVILSFSIIAFRPNQQAFAATSSTVNFQARLQQANGALVPDGFYNVEFKIYTNPNNDACATGSSNLWTETYYDSDGGGGNPDNRLRVANGYLSANLGSLTAFSGIDWDQRLCLGMNIGGTAHTGSPTWDGEMTPRMKLTAVPYAFEAGVAANVASNITNAASTNSNAVSIQSGNATGATSNSGNITIDSGTATGTTGTITIGNVNASALTLGKSGLTTTNTGNLTIQGGTSTLGTTSQAGTLILYDIDGGTNEKVTINTGNIITDYTLTLPTGDGDSGDCLKDTNGSGVLGFGACAVGGGDSITVEAVAATDPNFINTVATTSVAATTWDLQTGPTPDTIALTVGTASATEAGIVTATGSQTFAGDKTFSGNVTVQGTTGFTLSGSGSAVTFQNSETIKNTTDGSFTFGRNDAGTVTLTAADNDAVADLTITPGGTGQLVLNSAHTSAGAIDLNATGTVSGNAITFDTTDGGILLNADGAANGDVNITAEDDFTVTINDDINFNGIAGSAVNIGTSNVTQTITLGFTSNTDLALQDANWSVTGAGAATFANTTNGASAGSGLFTNNGATFNTTLALTDDSDGGVLGTNAASTVDIYTSISLAQTTASQTFTIASPTASTNYGRMIYVSNIGTASFTIGTSAILPGTTAAFIWSNSNGGASWQYAGDGGGSGNYIQNQIAAQQATSNFWISATGRADTSFLSPLHDALSGGALSLGTSNATSVTIGSTTNTTSIALQGAAAATYDMGTATGTGTITIGKATTASTQTVNIQSANGTASTQTIEIGGGTSTTSGGKVVNIANGIPGASTTNTVAIATAGTTTGTVGITIGSIGAANHTTVIRGGNVATAGSEALRLQVADAGGIAIGTATQTGAITLGNATTAATATVNILSENGTSSTQTVTIGGGTSTTAGGKVVNIATGVPGSSTTNAINIGNGGTTTGTVGVSIGSNGAANHTTTIQGGNSTGAISIQAATSGTVSIGTTAALTAVNIATGAFATPVTIGNSTGGAIRVGQNGGTLQLDGTNFDVSTVGVVTLAGAQTADITSQSNNAITITPGGTGAITLNSSNTSASAIGLNATGTVSGNAITLTTTDGGIRLFAQGAANGDIAIDSTDDISINGIASSLVNIGTSNVTQTITIGFTSNTDTIIQDANWGVDTSGVGTFANITCNSSSCISTGEITTDTIDWTDISDTMTLDDPTTIAYNAAANGTGLDVNVTNTTTQTSVTGFEVTPTNTLDAADITLTGININPNTNSNDDSGDTLIGLNLATITGTTATEHALRFGINYDADLFFLTDATHTFRVQDQDTEATAGSDLQFTGAAGNTTGAGGAILLTAGAAGGGANATGGALTFTTGAGGGSGTANSGVLTLLTGNAASGAAGNISIDVGTSSSGNGSILIGTAARPQTITIGGNTGTVTLNSAATVASAIALNATGTVAGNAITLTTTNAAIRIHAQGSPNGDMYFETDDNMDFLSDGDISYTTSDDLQISIGDDINFNGAAGSLFNIGITAVTQTITIGALSSTNLILQDADWNVAGTGAASFASVTATGGTLTVGSTANTGTIVIHDNDVAGGQTLTLNTADISSSYVLTFPAALPGSTQCITSTSGGTLAFASCGGGGAAKATLIPEFPGGVLTPDGANNTGTMTSDFCSKSNTNPADVNTAVCATANDYHNYYSWTASATNDYDIWVTWQVPSSFTSFTASPAISFYGWRTSTSDSVTMTVYDDQDAICGSATAISGTVATWNSTNITTSSCSNIAAGDIIMFRIQLSVGVTGEYARMGEITINYNQ